MNNGRIICEQCGEILEYSDEVMLCRKCQQKNREIFNNLITIENKEYQELLIKSRAYDNLMSSKKTAKEMFEELEYRCYGIINNDNLFYKKGKEFGIVFYLQTKEYFVGKPNECLDEGYEKGELHSVCLEEHKAIHQQMKELGWLE